MDEPRSQVAGQGLGGRRALGPDDLQVGLRAASRVVAAWGLTTEEERALLGGPSAATLQAWRRGDVDAVPSDLTLRLSHLLAIYGALHRLYVQHHRGDAWVRRPNSGAPFGGQAPLTRLLRGGVADLAEVRRYVEGMAGSQP